MKRRLTIALLGATVLDVALDTCEQPPAVAEADAADGPVTDRRSPPALGFGPARRDPHRVTADDSGAGS